MPGLDRKMLDAIDHATVIERVKLDIRSDFILAPHYNAIFLSAGDELWSRLGELLRSGNYSPALPHTVSVPKEHWFTRPGSILQPLDRFLYQALIDGVSDTLERNLDRERSFSHVISDDPQQMFVPAHECWRNFQEKVSQICGQGTHVLKADISNYFERIPQHHLINLMSAAGCPGEIVNLLEEMLLAFQERDSFGIVQGLYPSDVLGNFFLSDFDAFCELQKLPSARYVDDIYLSFESEAAATKGLINLIDRLRRNGLHLNENKSGIFPSDHVIREETAVDRLFEEVRENITDEIRTDAVSLYAFEADWEIDDEIDDDEIDEEVVVQAAVKSLFNQVDNHPKYADRIEKFCLPILRTAGSDIAVGHVLNNLLLKPHQTRLYFSYLSGFVRENPDVTSSLEEVFVSYELVSDYQEMFLLATLMRALRIKRQTINTAIQWLQNRRKIKETRAMAAIFASRHGNPTQKRAVKLEYENEPSDYVRSAILYASRFLPTAEKRTCKKAWGAHSTVNALIAQTI